MILTKVKTKAGWVQGLPSGCQTVSVFRGIPYGMPPVGNQRWRSPEPIKPWEGIHECFDYPNNCPQGEPSHAGEYDVLLKYKQSEDCLHLSVWTPAETGDEKLPVAVHFHGGGYRVGSSYYRYIDGDAFGQRGVILVSVEFRSGIFGYLAHPELTAEDANHSSGNQITLDQLLALQWVQENISAFGGDPDNVGIFGQSSGGCIMHFLSATPLSKGLFKRVIVQSSGALWQIGHCTTPSTMRGISLEQDEALGARFFSYLGVKSLAEARRVPASELVVKYKSFCEETPGARDHVACIDGYVFPENSVRLMQEGKHMDVDYMVGNVIQETPLPFRYVPSRDELVKEATVLYEEEAEAYLATIGNDEDTLAELYHDVLRDAMMGGNHAFCINQNRLGRRPAYFYSFSKTEPGQETRHASELYYVFSTLSRSPRLFTGEDWEFANKMCDYWTNFFKTGNPNGAGLSEWRPYTEDAPQCLQLAEEIKMIDPPNESVRMRFLIDYVVSHRM